MGVTRQIGFPWAMATSSPCLPKVSDAASKDKNKNDEKNGGLSSTSSGPGVQPPDMFLCPISREVMRDPVVLVETGQMYDRSSIMEWFKMDHNTCPLTGGEGREEIPCRSMDVKSLQLLVGRSGHFHAKGHCTSHC